MNDNSVMVIHPYLHKGTWVFDDEDKGLAREPFIAGIDTLPPTFHIHLWCEPAILRPYIPFCILMYRHGQFVFVLTRIGGHRL